MLLVLILGVAALSAGELTSPGTTEEPLKTTTATSTTAKAAITSCKKDEFFCTNGFCIPEYWTCDDMNDCDGGEDEANCEQGQMLPDKATFFGSSSQAPPTGCGEEEFKCSDWNRTHARCVPRFHLCDGAWDCEDGSDEGGLCNSCPRFGCAGDCVENPLLGPKCICGEGEILAEDSKECKDLDECVMEEPCAQLCTNEAPGYRCACAEGFRLADDRRGCELERPETAALFISYNHRLKRLPLGGLVAKAQREAEQLRLLSQGSGAISGLDYYDGLLYLASDSSMVNTGSINVLRPSESETAEERPLIEGIAGATNVAVDWVVGLVYYVATDSGQKDATRTASIGACTLDGRFCALLNLSNPIPHRPRGIVLHPRRGLIFWSDWGRRGPRIEAAAMDGSWRESEFLVKKLEWPNALAMDYASERLYWADAQFNLIESFGLKTQQRHVVLSDGVHHPFDMAAFDGSLYWTDWVAPGVHTARLRPDGSVDGASWILAPGTDDQLHYGLALDHPAYHSQGLPNPCALANCSHICALAPDSPPLSPESQSQSVPLGGVVARCLCPVGYMKDPLFPETDCILDPSADWSSLPRLAESEFQRRCNLGTACENGGVCLPQWKRAGKAELCECEWGYSGRFCEVDEGRRWRVLGTVPGRGGNGVAWAVALVIVALLLLLLASLTAWHSRAKLSGQESPLRKISKKPSMPRIPSVSFIRTSPETYADKEERQSIVRMEDGQRHMNLGGMDCFENPAYSASASPAPPPPPPPPPLTLSVSAPVSPYSSAQVTPSASLASLA